MNALPIEPTERDRERFRDITKAMRFGLEYDRRLAANGDYTDQQTVAMFRLWWSVERERQLLQNLNQSQGCKISELLERAEKAEAELAMMAKQEPVAFWWIGEGGENHGGPYRGMASEFSIDNARNSGCSPQYLYAAPVPAVAAGLPAIGPYRDFIPAPAVPAPSVPEEWREVMTELADDLAIEIDQSYPPERRAYPSEQRRYENEMQPVYRARALLQSSQAAPAVPEEWLAFAEFAARYKAGFHSKMRSGECPCWQCEVMRKARALLQSVDHSERNLEKVAPDCRACANRGRVNGLSQESYCDSCVYQGRDCRQNHFVDASKMVDAVKRRCEACAILPCSCK